MIRPRGEHSETTSVYLGCFRGDEPSLLRARDSGDRQMQKETFAKLFAGSGWEVPRVIEQMLGAKNFYFDQYVQVKLPKWSQERAVLLGDAAWAPSPLTGQGTQLAILGGYVLAQELARHRDHGLLAFEKYEKRLRRHVEDAQNIPLGGYAPYVLNPQSSFGIWLFRNIASFISWTKVLNLLPKQQAAAFDLEIEKAER